MKIFLDTASIDEIRACAETGMIDGITTNPTLIAGCGGNLKQIISEICSLVHGPVSAEVISTDFDGMLKEGRELAKIASNVVVKVPLTFDGLRVCRELSLDNIPVNVTLCFSAAQALLAAKAGARFVSPFVGRIDDTSNNGMDLISDICTIFNNYSAFSTEVLVASVRHPRHVVEAALIGAHTVTLPSKIFRQLYQHPQTDLGLEAFLNDWKRAQAC